MSNEPKFPVLDVVADTNKALDDPTNSLAKADPNAHISKKVYMFPESYNALRRELEEYFPNLWNSPVQWAMWANAQLFIQIMDEALDTVTQFDSANVDGICKKYLDELRKKRGLLPLHNPHEYFHNQAMEDEVRLARDVHENSNPWTQ
jgi:hypothetical protein